MSNKVQRKNWLDYRSKKLQATKYHSQHKKTTRYSKITNRNAHDSSSYIGKTNAFSTEVPLSFSFTENTESTINFFDEFIQEIMRKIYKRKFYINSYNVETVTVDAIIYLIAIMENIKINKQMHYAFVGSLPKQEYARNIYNESGFMSYVSPKEKHLPNSTNKMKITSGNKNDPVIASKMCEFVMEKLNKRQQEIVNLQKVLIELMSNVYHHAYNNDDIMKKHWYIYAEYIDNFVRFVFVDTGAGIARTVRKHFFEKVKSVFGGNTSDGDLIYSTLKGDFRTETNKKYRGNGLHGVSELALTGIFKSFFVISGSGGCIISKNNNGIIKNDYNNKIYGTIFVFDVI